MRDLAHWHERLDELERDALERLAEIDRRLEPMQRKQAEWLKRFVEVFGDGEKR